ncbi:lipase-like domain-containing protein, partial [Staphylococcus hominis]|uniref:lipase-like domain-containing protein n=1 Tax=Staphylococcus hominis TaxID=1290 RepID=UPI003709811D
SEHPFNEAYREARDRNEKGIWEVRGSKDEWDDVEFVGEDSRDRKGRGEELEEFWYDLGDDLVETEGVR